MFFIISVVKLSFYTNRKISLSEKGATERSAGDVDNFMHAQNDSSARLGDVMGDLSSKFRAEEQ